MLSMLAGILPAFAQAPAPTIRFEKTGPATVPPGAGPFTYIITATNNGPGNTDPLIITDTLPPEVQYISHEPVSSSTISCAFTAPTLECARHSAYCSTKPMKSA